MRVRELRKTLGISVAELARRCEVSSVAVVMWENGRNLPATVRLPEVAAALECEVGDLYEPDEIRCASEEVRSRIHAKAVADAKKLCEEGEECRAST